MVPLLIDIQKVSVDGYHSCALDVNGEVTCWGALQVLAPEGPFVDISLGMYHSCGLRTDGSVECWSAGLENKDVGQFDVPEGVVFRQISSGAEHVCGLDDVGLIHCWGAGQSDLGVSPDFGQSIVPAGVFTKVVSGDYHSCGQDEEGYVTCWGNSENGRLNVPKSSFFRF